MLKWEQNKTRGSSLKWSSVPFPWSQSKSIMATYSSHIGSSGMQRCYSNVIEVTKSARHISIFSWWPRRTHWHKCFFWSSPLIISHKVEPQHPLHTLRHLNDFWHHQGSSSNILWPSVGASLIILSQILLSMGSIKLRQLHWRSIGKVKSQIQTRGNYLDR